MKKKTIKALGLDRPARNPRPNTANLASRLRRIKTEIDLISAQLGDFLEREEVHQQDQRKA